MFVSLLAVLVMAFGFTFRLQLLVLVFQLLVESPVAQFKFSMQHHLLQLSHRSPIPTISTELVKVLAGFVILYYSQLRAMCFALVSVPL